MIDTTKPAPGFDVSKWGSAWGVDRDGVLLDDGLATRDDAIAESHRLYAEFSAPAVLDFAERFSMWLLSEEEWINLRPDDYAGSYTQWVCERLLAAARDKEKHG